MTRTTISCCAAFLVLAACARSDGNELPPMVELPAGAAGTSGEPRLSPDGTRLAWSQSVQGESKIFVGGPDGSNPVRLSSGTWDNTPIWSPDGRWIAYFGESPNFDTWVVPADGGEPRLLTGTPGLEIPMAWLADGSGVVVLVQAGGEVRTLVAPLDGGPLRPLVEHPGANQIAIPSPDGRRIALYRNRGSESTIWVQDAAGGAARQLTNEGLEWFDPSDAVWSPDSRRIAFISRRTGTTDIWTADVETGELLQVTTDVRNDQEPKWSPDGQWIAFRSDRGGQQDVWVAPSVGGEARRVTNDAPSELGLGWTRDGQALYFVRNLGDAAVGVVEPGSDPRYLFTWAGGAVRNLTASPDGNTLLFSGGRSGNEDIWSVPVAGGEPTPFITGPMEDDGPRYSPDGTQVLFTSLRGGSRDVWMADAAGGQPRQLTSWPGDEGRAEWSPDGSQIAFMSNHEAAQSDLWLMPATGGTPRRVTTLDNQFLGRPQWSPDGRSIYLMAPGVPRAELFRVPVGGGRPTRVPLAPTVPDAGSLSPDGSLYAYSSVDGGWATVWVVPTRGTGAARRVTPRTERVWQPFARWSPDGKRLAVSDWQFGDVITTDVVELSLSDTTTRRLARRPRSVLAPQFYLPDGRLVFTAGTTESQIVQVQVTSLLTPP